MRVVVAGRAGGPEVLQVVEAPDPVPGPGELLVEVAAAGVNFIDTYRRSGIYPLAFPHAVGSEGAGRVVAVGPGGGDDAAGPGGGSAAGGGLGEAGDDVVGRVGPGLPFRVGDRVAWAAAAGSYAERVVVRADAALPVPGGLDDATAAALPLQGMTAHYLATSTFPVEAGHDVLLHAAAGGVGLLLTQLVTARGGRVIATVGSAEKEALARAAGAAEVIRYRELADLTTDLPAAVRALTGGRGVDVVYDAVGKDTFDASLASLARRGTLVLYGGASGQVPPVDLQRLNAAGSVYVTRPTLGDYTATRAELLERATAVFAAAASGELAVRIGARFPLADAAEAHRALEGRATTGKVLLIP